MLKAVKHVALEKTYISERGYKIRNQGAAYFISFAVVEWIDLFIRKQYRDIVFDSIKFCQTEKVFPVKTQEK
ncbi:MAG: hypothetical protein JSU05_00430 [Bacteroidetes bacterium]|nr:hypothetical protein [Bacteroidota bacterium]